MGFGGRKFESFGAASQTQLRSEDGSSSRKEEGQNRGAKYSAAHFSFKLATVDKQTRATASVKLASCF
jgi:hypothetical protein